MTDLNEIAPAFVKMAHEIVWCSAATVDRRGRPFSRILHPIWQWEGGRLTGWIATGPTPLKRAHLDASPHVSLSYWAPTQDTCGAECRAEWVFDDEARQMVWDTFVNGPPPVGYDPAMIPGWDDASSPAFAALKLDPWRLRLMHGSALMQGTFETLTWRE